MKTSSRAGARKKRRNSGLAPSSRLGNEAIELFAWLLARCGLPRIEAAKQFASILERIPHHVGNTHIAADKVMDPAAHVVSLWHLTPEYVNQMGRPIALPLRGAAPSVEALVHRVDPNLTVDGVLALLIKTGSVRGQGARYIARSRAISYRHTPQTQYAHHLRVVTGLLRTVEHNARTPKPPRWFEYAADGLIPENRRRAFDRDFASVGMELLQYADAFMLDRSRAIARTRRKVPLTVGLYTFEARPLPSLTPRAAQRVRSNDKKARKPASEA